MTDVSTDTGALRETIARRLSTLTTCRGDEWPSTFRYEQADAVLALPALRDLIAERDQAVAAVERVRAVLDAAVERVRAVLDALDETAAETTLRPVVDATVVSRHIRRALDGAT